MSSSRTHFRARCKSSPFVPERFNLPGDSVPFFFALMARLLSDACQRHGESGFFHFLNSLETPIYRNKILNGVGCHPRRPDAADSVSIWTPSQIDRCRE